MKMFSGRKVTILLYAWVQVQVTFFLLLEKNRGGNDCENGIITKDTFSYTLMKYRLFLSNI
jgi:hypothetical protein